MLRPGDTLAGYRIEGILGQGGMGVVYEAVQLSLDRAVALKVLDAQLTGDGAFRERFRREGLIQARMDHPHIVPIHEAGEHDGRLFLAMRLVRGPTLRELIDSGSLTRSRALELIAQVADALDAAHARGLVHRDVKPQNILLDEEADRVFLADFGLTKGASTHTVTREGSWVGTPNYMSPEQIRGDRATPASDVYALTAVLVECLTGKVPFPKDSESAVLFAHAFDPPPRISERRPDLPAAIDAVIARGLAKDPADRPQAARTLVALTQRAFESAAAPAPAGEPAPAPRRSRATDERTRLGRRRRRPAGETPPAPPRPAPPAPAPSAPAPSAPAPSAPAPPARAARPAPPAPAPPAPAPPAPAPPAPAPSPTAPPASAPPAPAEAATAPTEPAAPGPTVLRKRKPAQLGATVLSKRERPAPADTDTVLSDRRPPEPQRRSWLPAAGAAGAAAALAAGAFVIGSSGAGAGSDTPSSQASVVGAGAKIALPVGWQRSAGAAPIAGLDLENELVLAGPDGQTLVAGRADAGGDASALPAALAEKLERPAGGGQLVSLRFATGYRYTGLKIRGVSAPATAYAVPTTAGVLTLTCLGSPSGTAACDRVAASAEPRGAKPLSVEPDGDYAADLDSVMTSFNRSRTETRRSLRTARTSREQSSRGRAVAATYTVAHRSLQSLKPAGRGADAQRAILQALTSGAAAHTRLAAAARSESRGAYRRASAAVARADGRLDAALRQLRALGYKVS